MENFTEAKQTITDAKNIYVIPGQSPEAIAASLALFYTLKKLDKNVNLVAETLPEQLQFLSPSLDFVSYPKNFVVSIPNNVAGVSQIYYEKNADALKIYLTVEKGTIKKDNISFYYSETKPDVILAIGIEDYTTALSEKLNAFGFLLDSPIVNIDNGQNNKKFGNINIVEDLPLAHAVFQLVGEEINTEAANCLLSSLVIYTENFKHHVTADTFQAAAELMKKGADLQEISKHIIK